MTVASAMDSPSWGIRIGTMGMACVVEFGVSTALI
jgi:hypothetical protein